MESLCPECLLPLPATLLERDGGVWMEKSCPLHGPFEDVVARRADLYHKMERYAFDDAVALAGTPGGEAGACPQGCGLCSGHASTAIMTNLDLTNRCNLRCPVCFANAAVQPYVCEPSLPEIEQMLDRALAVRPKRLQAIQFSGGEPTLSPHFLAACKAARDRGVRAIQAATNGILFARDETFAARAAAAGLNGIYLQFDGLDDEAYRANRGADGLWALKLAAIRACKEAGIRVTLVPTVIRGVNDHQVGEILKFAAAHMEPVVAVSFQPVAFTGRIDSAERLARRYTLSDLATDLERQTGLLDALEDWYPLSALTPFSRVVGRVIGTDAHGFGPMHCNAHPGCGMSAYLLVNPSTGQTVPLTRLFDVPQLLQELSALAERAGAWRPLATAQLLRVFLRAFRPECAPRGLTWDKLFLAADALSGRRLLGLARKHRYEWRLLFVTTMHFQDAYNYQVDRVKRCTVHYSAPDGRIYPFCTFNTGASFRERVERAHGVPKEVWVRERGGQFVTEGFDA